MVFFQSAAIVLLLLLSKNVNASDQSFALCGDQKGFIRCTNGTQIQILSANYGRTDEQVCPTGKIKTSTCHSKMSEIKTKWNCNGYRTCHLHAAVQHFGDPCPNYSKYLEVKYRCVKDPNIFPKGKLIAFNAFIIKSLHLKRGTPVNVVYDGVYYNYGNAYNQHTGVFTAPSDGLYVFTWSSCVEPKKIFDVEILLNGKRKGLGNCNNELNKGYENCSNTFPFVLRAGDKVNIRTTYANYLHGSWSSFSGWKV
ncbi:uncharacterized protein LOC133198433 [Saccostrea echinata]|uniref:uncharacterized protein LOC133198433 n=1 Tax=Saccostrea echinata TaxID=191078 RepID=UPI002A82BDAA|nr:uncharacterized protein LOC133198433 [Saccostrea echinata]